MFFVVCSILSRTHLTRMSAHSMIKKKFGRQQTTFSERVVKIALAIPKGKVMTYGGIARKAGGGPMASQSITSILGKAYEQGEKNIPFHRIVYADGRVWMDEKHREERMRRYKEEGITLDKRGRIKNFNDTLFDIGPMQLNAVRGVQTK